MDKSINANLHGLEALMRALKGDYVLRVGLIGSKGTGVHDSESGKTNAEIGSFHEFGTGKMPRRSFLEDSLKFRLNVNGKAFKEVKKYVFKKIFQKKNPQEFLQYLGSKCLEIIEEGFSTNGFGQWKPLSDKLASERMDRAIKAYNRALNAMRKGKSIYDKAELNKLFDKVMHYEILTDTGKMRKSIAFKVFKRK